MSCVESGKWTCPDCNRCLVVHGSEPDCRTAIRAVQSRHARGHAQTSTTPSPHPTDRRQQ